MKTRTLKNVSNCLKTLLIAAVFAPAVTLGAVDGGGSTGGGGGICINQKCMTLAQAGMAPSDPSVNAPLADRPAPAVSKELANKYSEIYSSVYKKAPFTSVVLSIDETDLISKFERVNVYDPQAIERIKEQYKQIMAAAQFPTDNLELFAVSNADKTYLLPKFYSLSPTSQVLIMFHENLMRYYYKDSSEHKLSEVEALKLILGFDSGIVKLMNNNYSAVPTLLEASMLRQGVRRSQFLPFSAFVSQYSLGQGFIRLNQSIFEDLSSKKRFVKPSASDDYSDFSFWQNFNKIYPQLSAVINKYDYKSLQISGVYTAKDWNLDDLFNANYSHGLEYTLKSLATSVCIHEKLESAFLTVLPGYGSDLDSTIIVCKDNRLEGYALFTADKN